MLLLKTRPRRHSQLYSDINWSRAILRCCNASCRRRFPAILLPAMHNFKKCWNGGWRGKLKRRFWHYRLIGEWSRSGHRQNHWCLSSSKTSANFFAINWLRLVSATVFPEAFWRLEQCKWWDMKRLARQSLIEGIVPDDDDCDDW